MIAALGGYVDQKGAGPPGVKMMWRGMIRMADLSIQKLRKRNRNVSKTIHFNNISKESRIAV